MKLIEMVLVVTAVIADLMLCTKWFREILDRKFTLPNRIILILVFGAISVYGTYSGIEINGAVINIRDLGPLVGGLIGGPAVGLASGLIGGIHRYLLGGFTGAPCSLATVLAGLIGGAAFWMRKGRLVTVNQGLFLAVGVELLHMSLGILLARPLSEAILVVEAAILPMVLANALGAVIFVLVFSHGAREIERDEELHRYVTDHKLQLSASARAYR